eukprot:UN04146
MMSDGLQQKDFRRRLKARLIEKGVADQNTRKIGMKLGSLGIKTVKSLENCTNKFIKTWPDSYNEIKANTVEILIKWKEDLESETPDNDENNEIILNNR